MLSGVHWMAAFDLVLVGLLIAEGWNWQRLGDRVHEQDWLENLEKRLWEDLGLRGRSILKCV
jgi:hypothetical protein